MREVARDDKPYMRKSTDRKAQISKAFVQLSGLICALRSCKVYHSELPASRTISFSISNSFWYYRKRGNASYIVREVHSVREREREKDGSDATIVALKLAMSFALLLAKNVHHSTY